MWRRYRIEICWGAFTAAMVGAMFALQDWLTLPFHLIWISLAIVYGFRVWTTRPTVIVLAVISAVTLAPELVSNGVSPELVEVPMMAGVLGVMVWHARRREAALAKVRAAAEREHDFVRDAAHHLRSPITIARGHAQLLRTSAVDEASAADATIVLEELERLRRIAQRLLILATTGHGSPLLFSPVNVRELLDATVRRWSDTAPRRFRVAAQPDLFVCGERDQLEAALDALVENAVHATRAGGLIELRGRLCERSVSIEVCDDGHGIDPEEAGRIFERFVRGDGVHSRPGTGLGLPIVKAIAEAHRGSVSVRSAPSGGACFELLLEREGGLSIATSSHVGAVPLPA